MEGPETGSPTMKVKEELQEMKPEDAFGSDQDLDGSPVGSPDFDMEKIFGDDTSETGAGSTKRSNESKKEVRDAHNHAKRPSRSSRATDLFDVEDDAVSSNSELSTDKEEA